MANVLTTFVSGINKIMKKKYGVDTMFFGTDVGDFKPLITGFPTLDWLNSGIGGLPRGGMTLIHGMESTGKTSILLEIINHSMHINPEFTALYIDVENAITKQFLTFKNVDPSRFIISPLNNEDGLIQIEEALKQNIFDIIVFDSLAKFESQKVLDKNIDEKVQRNLRASVLTQFFRRISLILRNAKTAFVCINQEVANQDGGPYAPKTILPGPYQQRFSANLILSLRRMKAIKEGDKHIGYRMGIASTKNKISGNEKVKSELVYLFGKGFIRGFSILDYLVVIGEVKKLPMGRFEFVKKEYYGATFKVGEIGKILESIKDSFGIDLSEIKPPEGIELDKAKDEGEEVLAEEEVSA